MSSSKSAEPKHGFAIGQRVMARGDYGWAPGRIDCMITVDDVANGYTAVDIGKWKVLLDDSTSVKRQRVYSIAAFDTQLEPLTRDSDPKFQGLIKELAQAVAVHGAENVQAALDQVTALDLACQAGHHEWGSEHGGYGGANERKDCQRPGCAAFVLD
jgi:hypothetical protein